MEENNKIAEKVLKNIATVIVGKEDISRLLLTALLADGHVLLEDVPGTGKTKLAKTLAASLSAGFSRIQFTPDLLPTDITGLNIFDRNESRFVLRKGPVFTNILLADEINRATPRTQSGLLECMEEKQVTIDGKTYLLEEPFFVIATQNPIETAGTFPLPEAQMDRFMMKLKMGLPSRDEELEIMDRFIEEDPLKDVKPVLTLEELSALKVAANKVFVHKVVREYIADIVAATREEGKAIMGVSPRGTLGFLHCAKAYAMLQGRNFVTPDDVKTLAVPVLAHRIVLPLGYGKNHEEEKMVRDILAQVTVPTEDYSK